MTAPAARPGTRLLEQEIGAIGVEAYVYLCPLVLMEITRRQMTNAAVGAQPGFGPMGVFSHIRQFPTAEFKAVVRPNFDTLYSIAWLDLAREPVVVSVPDTGGRYYLLPMYDMWTDAFAAPGKRTSGTRAAHYAVVPPGWRGDLPGGVEAIQAPTTYVWLIGRTQTNGPADYAAVHAIQDGFTITPLSLWGRAPAPVPARSDPSVDMQTPPVEQVTAMTARDYFGLAAELLKIHPPHVTDWSILSRMRRIGLRPGHDFGGQALDPALRQVLDGVPAQALALMRAAVPRIARVVNGWQMNTDSIGVYGNNYLKRAIIAMAGLGANPPEDAVYPLNVTDADGQPLDGTHGYLLHFDRDELPPAGAFWSVTMYHADGFPAANPINRYAIGDRDDLAYNADGSLDIYIQHTSPGPGRERNWLPAPPGPLGVTMRVYAPEPQALDGRWNPPAITRTSHRPHHSATT
jgi:hypothetical protein